MEMTAGLKLRTLHWDFVGSLEPPRVVSCRTEEALGKGNVFGQVTIRFHTQQLSTKAVNRLGLFFEQVDSL
ncbi:unnamed protein product [Hymenolepis diminuta]|uniref:Uncharacterized protein n=1 Tax=Hymenolepis diminuta TaxID=6216 RepID=A0A0R3SKX8_HYMDI|nr:unnamed protein product [Hymenolepis diminuta]